MPEREYLVQSTYKVTGSAIIRARSAKEAVEIGLSEDTPKFHFSDAWGETRMTATRLPLGIDKPINCPPKTDRQGDEAVSQNAGASPSRAGLGPSARTATLAGPTPHRTVGDIVPDVNGQRLTTEHGFSGPKLGGIPDLTDAEADAYWKAIS